MGCIFQLFIDTERPNMAESTDNRRVTSPSLQGIIDENGKVLILSTHEQVLDNQVYLGCEFPCKQEYRLQLMEYGRRVYERTEYRYSSKALLLSLQTTMPSNAAALQTTNHVNRFVKIQLPDFPSVRY